LVLFFIFDDENSKHKFIQMKTNIKDFLVLKYLTFLFKMIDKWDYYYQYHGTFFAAENFTIYCKINSNEYQNNTIDVNIWSILMNILCFALSS
jgi:hypothetical protein